MLRLLTLLLLTLLSFLLLLLCGLMSLGIKLRMYRVEIRLPGLLVGVQTWTPLIRGARF